MLRSRSRDGGGSSLGIYLRMDVALWVGYPEDKLSNPENPNIL
jgi:hypothetical protein